MPSRLLVAKELADILKVIAHPDRIRLIEELRPGEQDVNTLSQVLNLPGPRISQHFSLMRAHRLVEERREGRRHLYRLIQPEIAEWIVEGIGFIEARPTLPKSAIESVKELWTKDERHVRDDKK